MDFDQLLRKYRKNLLVSDNGSIDTEKVIYKKSSVEKIVPHRDPFLLVDAIHSIDLDEQLIVGSYNINKDNPILKGHFPGMPIYPGTLQVEMIGQLGLCLGYFIKNNIDYIEEDKDPEDIRATKILGAHFLNPLEPGRDAVSIAKILDFDDIFGTVIGQVISDDKICCVSIGEVYFVD